MSSNSRNLLRGGGHARGRGRVQCGVWEALVFNNGLATTSAVLGQIYVGKQSYWRQNGGGHQPVRPRLDAIADPVGPTRGRRRPRLLQVPHRPPPPRRW